jgi:hypothetical protein
VLGSSAALKYVGSVGVVMVEAVSAAFAAGVATSPPTNSTAQSMAAAVVPSRLQCIRPSFLCSRRIAIRPVAGR